MAFYGWYNSNYTARQIHSPLWHELAQISGIKKIYTTDIHYTYITLIFNPSPSQSLTSDWQMSLLSIRKRQLLFLYFWSFLLTGLVALFRDHVTYLLHLYSYLCGNSRL